MLASFERPETSKHLYFNLNNALHLADPIFSPTYRIAGLYAIYKNNVCYYVGQSKNLPSRLSTHLTGKYESCDLVELFFVDDDDFYIRSKEAQKLILETNESLLIELLKPIENLYINKGLKYDYSILFECLKDPVDDRELSVSEDLCVFIRKHTIDITNDQMHSVDSLNEILKENYISLIKYFNREV